jgi:formate dehydrogenase iron-sulfur subunit
MMMLSRRNFFKIMGGAGASLATITGNSHAGESAETFDSFGCLVDITRCIGCRKCEVACNAHNKLPHQDFNDMTVLDDYRRPDWEKYTVINRHHGYPVDDVDHNVHIYVKEQCRHCVKPSCASACVVGALTKKKNGPVVYDEKKCIGCRYCMVACPFQIPAYEDHNPVTPRVIKCTFCYDRIEQGKMPACATICPTQAMIFGKRDALLSIAKKRLKNNPGKYIDHIYGEYEVGGTSWLYLSPVEFSFFPELGNKPPPKLTEMILSGVFGYAAAPTSLFAILGAISWINNRKRSITLNEVSGREGEEK